MPFNPAKWVTLKTPRLVIIALDLDNLYHYCHHYGEVQRNLGLEVTMEEQDREIKYVFLQAHYAAMNDPNQYLWYTSWEMVLTSENVIIGGLCFKGPPDENGTVEIGYGIELEYQNCGYTTEALKAMIDWAKNQPNVKQINASTEPDNIASHSLLIKAGFEIYGEFRGLSCWRKKLD